VGNNSQDRPSTPILTLSEDEKEVFEMFRTVVKEQSLQTTVRVAGGWVRDKLLGLSGKEDIDVALDDCTGRVFCEALNEWSERTLGRSFAVGIVRLNPDKSKHLETATMQLGRYSCDFVNLRTEEYASDSRVPTMELGSPLQDALRRDLTINALFYNVNTGVVEDLTGHGLKDLSAGVVNTPLDPVITLEDDPLRAMRLVRFAARLGFRIAAPLLAACVRPETQAALTAKVSRERVNSELEQMLALPEAGERAAFLLLRSGLLATILPTPTGGEEHGGATLLSLIDKYGPLEREEGETISESEFEFEHDSSVIWASTCGPKVWAAEAAAEGVAHLFLAAWVRKEFHMAQTRSQQQQQQGSTKKQGKEQEKGKEGLGSPPPVAGNNEEGVGVLVSEPLVSARLASLVCSSSSSSSSVAVVSNEKRSQKAKTVPYDILMALL
jgi:tRNA nucleotidyltransferase/poly(A) polymerase